MKLLVKRENLGVFETTVVRDSFEAVKLKRELYSVLDQLFQRQGDGDKENNPSEGSNNNSSKQTFDSKSINKVYEVVDSLCSANIAALRDLRDEVLQRDTALKTLCGAALRALEDGTTEIVSLLETVRNSRAASSDGEGVQDSRSGAVEAASSAAASNAEAADKLLHLEGGSDARRNEIDQLAAQLLACEEALILARTQLSEKEAINSDLQTVLKSVRQRCADHEEALRAELQRFDDEIAGRDAERERMAGEIAALSNQLGQELANTAELTQRLIQLEDRVAGEESPRSHARAEQAKAAEESEASDRMAVLAGSVRELEEALRLAGVAREEDRQRDLMLRARMRQGVCVRAIRRWINMQLRAILGRWRRFASGRRCGRRLQLCVGGRRAGGLLRRAFGVWDARRRNGRRLWHAGVTAATRWIYRRASSALRAWWTLVFRVGDPPRLTGGGGQADRPRRAIDFGTPAEEAGDAGPPRGEAARGAIGAGGHSDSFPGGGSAGHSQVRLVPLVPSLPDALLPS